MFSSLPMKLFFIASNFSTLSSWPIVEGKGNWIDHHGSASSFSTRRASSLHDLSELSSSQLDLVDEDCELKVKKEFDDANELNDTSISSSTSSSSSASVAVPRFEINDIVEIRNPDRNNLRRSYTMMGKVSAIHDNTGIIPGERETREVGEGVSEVTYDLLLGANGRILSNVQSSYLHPVEKYPYNSPALCHLRKPQPCTVLSYLPTECVEMGGCYVVTYEKYDGKKVMSKLPMAKIQRILVNEELK